jgi:hypothetical protein
LGWAEEEFTNNRIVINVVTMTVAKWFNIFIYIALYKKVNDGVQGPPTEGRELGSTKLG